MGGKLGKISLLIFLKIFSKKVLFLQFQIEDDFLSDMGLERHFGIAFCNILASET